MRHVIAAAVFALAPMIAPVIAAAEQPISPSEFRDYAEGYTLYFERDGEFFGSEEFKPGGKTVWRYRDGTCVDGAWRAHGAQICFRYETAGPDGEVLCWRMLRRDDGSLMARLLGDGENAGLELDVIRRDREPLLCGGPGVNT